ncbi:MAG: hypothetical protein MMC23_005132 [Stictis urceolatum]|nr:hypothetical protein [Stictis urceolata]
MSKDQDTDVYALNNFADKVVKAGIGIVHYKDAIEGVILEADAYQLGARLEGRPLKWQVSLKPDSSPLQPLHIGTQAEPQLKMLETGNPRFAGDALLLARIKRAQVAQDRPKR